MDVQRKELGWNVFALCGAQLEPVAQACEEGLRGLVGAAARPVLMRWPRRGPEQSEGGPGDRPVVPSFAWNRLWPEQDIVREAQIGLVEGVLLVHGQEALFSVVVIFLEQTSEGRWLQSRSWFGGTRIAPSAVKRRLCGVVGVFGNSFRAFLSKRCACLRCALQL